MRLGMFLVLGIALAGCSQTTETASTGKAGQGSKAAQASKSAPTRHASAAGRAEASAQACADAVKKASDAQMGAAVLGGALSMVGGFGGYAGQAGMVAAQAASVGGSLVQQQASQKAEAAMRQSC
jgi:secreted effector protein SseD